MDNEIKKYLFDIKESVDSIENYLGEKRDFNVYKSNKCFGVRLKENLKLLEKL